MVAKQGECSDGEGNVSLCHSAISKASTAAAHHCSSTNKTSSATRHLDWDVGATYTIIPGRLSFAVYLSKEHASMSSKRNPNKEFLTTDMQNLYEPLCSDFGPVNLGILHAFCKYMSARMKDEEARELVYYSMDPVDVRTNCAFLLASFLIVDMGFSADDAWAPFNRIRGHAFATFRDATDTIQDYDLTILSCLRGLAKAISLGWYSSKTFDAEEYACLDDPAYADMHMMTPKFAAFRGPVQSRQKSKEHHASKAFPPEHFIDIFKSINITTVVRLNEPSTYEATCFTKAGLTHYDMYFDDCTVPTNSTVLKFLEMADKHDKIAVHCTAGLGRTGTLIAAYMMKYNGFTAAESIGWLRIVRPGSVLGPQQQYLHFLEKAFCLPVHTVLPLVRETSPKESSEMGRKVAEAQDTRDIKRIAASDYVPESSANECVYDSKTSDGVCVGSAVGQKAATATGALATGCGDMRCMCAQKRLSVQRMMSRGVNSVIDECTAG